jgi:hypothetical protein
MAAATLLVIHADEGFLVSPADPEWRHIAPFKWLLLPHGLAGAGALFTGPLQFSDRIRAYRPGLHRWTGRSAPSVSLLRRSGSTSAAITSRGRFTSNKFTRPGFGG